ncbi:MAG: 3-oxoacyl-[acyl-carrier protein] reductase [Planctomycetota bacterium]|jgi:3-oxoacyl-[acyl-carrier protein] reductase
MPENDGNLRFDFSGQRVVVTGGTRGIGAATTRAFLTAGATVHATYRSDDTAAEAMRETCGEDSERLSLHRFDLTDFAAVENFWNELDESAPEGVQVLVNNAGIRRDGVLAMMSPEDWSGVIDANLTSGFAMSKFAVMNMMRQRYGRILFLTSPAGRFGFEGQGNYSASKAGQVGLARSLSKETAKRGITVNCVSPGFIGTDLLSDLPDEQVKAYKKTIPLRRFGATEEIATACMFLASREASYITGETLEVSGGL